MSHNKPPYKGLDFLIEFFRPLEDPITNKAQYFLDTFVEPPDFEELLAVLQPQEGQKRVVIIDGQSRVGKTWAALGALTRLFEEGKIHTYWSAGEDSFRLFEADLGAGRCSDILSGLRRIHLELERLKTVDLIFLDDFLGTVLLRPLISPGEDIHELAAYLDWGIEDNILRSDLAETGGTLVITNRSTLLTSAEVKLGFPLRPYNTPFKHTNTIRISRGFFRTSEGKLSGTLNQDNIDNIINLNEIFINNNPQYQFPHLAAFVQNPPKELVNNQAVADALFGADYFEFALQISELEHADINDPRLRELDTAYFLLIMPGLVFPGPSIYSLLGIEQEARSLIKRLFLKPVEALELSHRLPNEFYVLALKHHFSNINNIALAVRVLNRVLETSSEANDISYHNSRVFLRGLAERAVDLLQSSSHDDDCLIPIEVMELLQKHNDPLFYWGMPESYKIESPYFELKPGFAASIGWSLSYYKKLRHSVGSRVVKWFVDNIMEQEYNIQSDKNLEDIKYDLLMTCYSTFLQWCINIDLKSGTEYIKLLSSIIPKLSSKTKNRLVIVLEDEFIWVDTLKGISLGEMGHEVAEKMLRSFERDDLTLNEKNRWRLANRLFSISWHNEWMASKKRNRYFRNTFNKWIERCAEYALREISIDPKILDSNLQYHWWHFITQHGVWMKNWCFQPEPFTYESNRPTPGSPNKEHNRLFLKLMIRLIAHDEDSSCYARRLRNCIMMIGTRIERLPEEPDILGYIDSIVEKNNRPDVRQSVLHAIFELSRQGYLDVWPNRTTDQFRNWCRAKINVASNMLENAWREYHTELENVTYLDLLPRKEYQLGWEDIKPIE